MASRVFISDHSHGNVDLDDLTHSPSKRKLVLKGQVKIENDVWIGEGVYKLPDVRIGRTRYAGRKSFRSALAVLDGVVPSDGELGVPKYSSILRRQTPPVRPTRRAGISCRFSFAWKTTILGSTYFHANENPSRTAPCTPEGLTPSVSSIIDANAVVTKSFPENSITGGGVPTELIIKVSNNKSL